MPAAGWSYDDRLLPTEPVRIYSTATIKSLWKLGLLDSNFIDPRGVGRSKEARLVENLDRARHTQAPHVRVLMVWTSALGKKALEESGLLTAQQNLAYH